MSAKDKGENLFLIMTLVFFVGDFFTTTYIIKKKNTSKIKDEYMA